ncbi:MazG-like family protein [Microaceticoccus formicicus]|uniref:MazG-like family protein n=1 Tax=Microaceticoccus formicicus TaxID=3118105 RepID=UPI003CD049C9|nr:MazG-like family protein [Peptoniphilaceae bacterium AMB_02]
MTNLNYLIEKIKDWAIDRNLHTGDPAGQINKLFEEGGEIAKAFNKQNTEDLKDGIGDVIVVLTVLSLQLNLDITECVKLAYEEIKDRRGKLINGVFVKESDLE